MSLTVILKFSHRNSIQTYQLTRVVPDVPDGDPGVVTHLLIRAVGDQVAAVTEVDAADRSLRHEGRLAGTCENRNSIKHIVDIRDVFST